MPEQLPLPVPVHHRVQPHVRRHLVHHVETSLQGGEGPAAGEETRTCSQERRIGERKLTFSKQLSGVIQNIIICSLIGIH